MFSTDESNIVPKQEEDIGSFLQE